VALFFLSQSSRLLTVVLAVLTAAGITDKATVADVEAELADLEEVEPTWELPAELQEYR
jgi:hypothetical protein